MTSDKVVVQLCFCAKHIPTKLASVLKHIGEVSALNVISNISRVPIRIVADNTRMLPAQIIFADITLKILRRRQST